MAKKKPTPENLRQGQTIYQLCSLWLMTRQDKYTIRSIFICSEKLYLDPACWHHQYPKSTIIYSMRELQEQFFPTYRSAVRWATDRKLTIVE